MLLTMLIGTALASIDPKCQDLADQGPPSDYSEQAQSDFLLNYFALSTTYSPLHAPIPAKSGHGAFGLELAGIPPLGCKHRLVLSYSKTEDTNKTPVVPRPRLSFSLPAIGKWVPYGSVAYFPPVTVLGTRNVILSGEIGAGTQLDSGLQLGGRFHTTVIKTVAEIAEPFVAGDPAYLDFYVGSTFGLDLMAGYATGEFTPYLSVGFLDASTFFYIGDDGFIGNNYSPYDGPEVSLGAQKRWKHLMVSGEFYSAFLNLNTGDLAALDGTAQAHSAPARIYTGRVFAGLAF